MTEIKLRCKSCGEMGEPKKLIFTIGRILALCGNCEYANEYHTVERNG